MCRRKRKVSLSALLAIAVTVLHNLKKTAYITAILFIVFNLNAQKSVTDVSGVYGDWTLGLSPTTVLQLKNDGTFKLNTVDYIYPRTFKKFSNEGNWIIKGKEVILNPHLKRRTPKVSINEKIIGLNDSIEIKVNHYVDYYENNKLTNTELADFETLTLYFGKKKKNIHLLRKAYIRKCAWAPRIKNQIIVDSSNTFRIAKKNFNKLGVYTYGFIEPIETDLKMEQTDYIEINISVPVDKERMPRSKKVIIKGKKAYFYEREGKVDQFWIEPLRKKFTRRVKLQ